MGQDYWWEMDVVLPAILLIVLTALVIKVRSRRDSTVKRRADEGTRELYAEEEERRRKGTDEL